MTSAHHAARTPAVALLPTRRHALALLAGLTAAPALAATGPAALVPDGTLPRVGFTYRLDGTELMAAVPVTRAEVRIDLRRPDASVIDLTMDAPPRGSACRWSRPCSPAPTCSTPRAIRRSASWPPGSGPT